MEGEIRDGAVLGQSPTDFGPTGVGARVEREENMERSSSKQTLNQTIN